MRSFFSTNTRRVGLAIAALGLVTLGCSSCSQGNGQSSSDLVNCDDPREQTYTANLKVPGAANAFTFVLVSSSPAPPAETNNTWTLQILDAAGNPVDGVMGTAVATMPLMSHGTIAITWTAGPAGSGTYTLQPLYFFMAGLWEVAITASASGQTDTTSYFFCVAG